MNMRTRSTGNRNRFRPTLENLEGRLLMTATIADFNGDGFGDYATSVDDAAEVRVVYGGEGSGFDTSGQSPARQQLLKPSIEEDNSFGAAMAAGDLNGDGYDDLAVGAPETGRGAGVVYVFYGSEDGLGRREFWHQNVTGMNSDGAEEQDHFGAALAIGNFNGDVNPQTGKAIDDLAIGVPDEDIIKFDNRGPLRIDNTGGVHVLYGTTEGLKVDGNQFWRQDGQHISTAFPTMGTEHDEMEGGDRFGATLAAGNFYGSSVGGTSIVFDDLAIGVPTERYHKFPVAVSGERLGQIHVIGGSPSGLISNNAKRIHVDSISIHGFVVAAADTDGDNHDDVVVAFAGSGLTVYSNTNGPKFDWQEVSLYGYSLPSSAIAFLPSVAVADYDGNGIDDVAVGYKLNGTQSAENAGEVHVLYAASDGSGLSAENVVTFQQRTAGISGTMETNDMFGKTLAAGDLNNDGLPDLVIGVNDGPRNEAVNVLFGADAPGGSRLICNTGVPVAICKKL